MLYNFFLIVRVDWPGLILLGAKIIFFLKKEIGLVVKTS